jgi:hypothetical protein
LAGGGAPNKDQHRRPCGMLLLPSEKHTSPIPLIRDAIGTFIIIPAARFKNRGRF